MWMKDFNGDFVNINTGNFIMCSNVYNDLYCVSFLNVHVDSTEYEDNGLDFLYKGTEQECSNYMDKLWKSLVKSGKALEI